MYKLAATLSLLTLLLGAPAQATHGNPIPNIAARRAQETCYDLKAGAPSKWALRKNVTVGLLNLADLSGGELRESVVESFRQAYQQSLVNMCKEELKSDGNQGRREYDTQPTQAIGT